jgi:hypothetical protein
MLLELTVVERMAEGGTVVIPGRGRICYQADVEVLTEMATIVRDRVKDSLKKGKSLAQVKADKPTEDYDPRYAPAGASPSADAFVEAVYNSLKSKSEQAGNR